MSNLFEVREARLVEVEKLTVAAEFSYPGRGPACKKLELARVVSALAIVWLFLFPVIRAADSPLSLPSALNFRDFGPVRLRPKLVISSVGYDSNVFLEATNTVSDYTGTVGPVLDGVVFLGEHAALSFRGKAAATLFARTSSQNSINRGMMGKVDVLLGPFLISTSADLSRSRRILNAELDRRTGFSSLEAKTDLRFAPSPKTEIHLGLRRNDIDHSGEEIFATGRSPEVLSRVDFFTTLGVRERILPKTRLGLELEIGESRFKDRQGLRDSRIRRAFVDVEFDPTAFLKGSGKLGWLKFRSRHFPEQDFGGLIGEVGLQYKAKSGVGGNLQFIRGLHYSIFGDDKKLVAEPKDNLYFMLTRYELALTLSTSRKMQWELGSGWGSTKYPLETTIQDLSGVRRAKREDRFKTYFLGGKYKANKILEVGARFGLSVRDSNLDAEDDRQALFLGDFTFGL